MLNAYHLRAESLKNPLGIDYTKPRLSWKLKGEEGKTGQYQSAYRIVFADREEDLDNSIYTYDTSKVISDSTSGIAYPGTLHSRQRVYWKVCVYDEDGVKSPFSAPQYFETGLLNPSDWEAKWIDPELQINPEERQPASYLRKCFSLSELPLQARLYITSCGMYKVMINGKLPDAQVLTPGTTQYNRRLQVQTFDATALLCKGENELSVILGDGWFRGMNGQNRNRNIYGEYIALLSQLEMRMADGRVEKVISDESWQAAQDGPIRFTDFMQGETYDANCAPAKWHEVRLVNLGYEHLIGSDSVPVKEHESFAAKLLYENENETVLDFGQNISGYTEFILHGSSETKGVTFTIEHGEALSADGKFTMENIEGAFSPKTPPLLQKVTYTASDKAEQHYKPSFSTFGFRYVKISGWPGKVNPEDFTAYAVYSDLMESASFVCSNELINQFVKNTLWSQKGNFADVPTDCPQRERAGYTGDAQVFVKAGSILMESLPFYRKWLADLRATQDETGKISNIAPMQQKEFEYFDGSAGWGDAIVIVPYVLYMQYGDREILEENFDAMKAWVDYELAEAKKNHPVNLFRWHGYKRWIWDTDKHWGEWLEPGQTMAYLIQRMYLGCPETATAYMYYSSSLLSETAKILGKADEAASYAAVAENIRDAYRVCFIKEAFRSQRQCLCVRPVFMKIASREEAGQLASRLNQLVIQNDYHLNTGFLSTPHICDVLSEYGYTDTAYRMIEQDTMPSWLYPVKKGATTIWEKWDGVKEDGSLDSSQNHYSYGAVVSWLFETVAGIRLTSPGYKTFRIAPQPGGTLSDVSAKMDTPHGPIRSQWQLKDGRCVLSAQIPVNTRAEVILPVETESKIIQQPENTFCEMKQEGAVYTLWSGSYTFTFEYER